MKNEYAILEAYIKNVCKGVKSRKVKEEIREELLSHMLEIYDRNIALGSSHEEAQIDVLRHMGNSENVSKAFKELYPTSVTELLKNGAWQIAYPMLFLCLNSFNLNALPLFFVTIGLTTLKNINKFFKASYNASLVGIVIHTVIFVFNSYYGFGYTENSIYFIVSQIFTILIYILIIIGIIQTRKDLYKTDVHLYLSIASLVIYVILSVFGLMYDNSFAWLAVLFLILPGISIYISVPSISELKEAHPLKIEGTARNMRLIVFAMCLLVVCGTINIGATRQPETKRLNNEDLQTDVSEITTNLLNLGLPENVVNDLPQSEIAKYENASKLEVVNDEDNISYTAYIVHITTENQPLKIRVLLVIDDLQNMEKLYRDEIYIDTNNHGVVSNGDVFFKFVSETNNRKKEVTPFNTFTFKEYRNTENVYAYNFGFPKDADRLTLYVSQTVTPKTDSEELRVSFYYHHTDSMTAYLRLSGDYGDRIDEYMNIWFDNPLY